MKGKLVGGVYVLDGIDSEKSELNDPIDTNKQYPSSDRVFSKLRFGPNILIDFILHSFF
jgi:hypothetical protein